MNLQDLKSDLILTPSDHHASRDLIAAIHAAPQQAVLLITGGGSGAISDLLGVPGGSRTLLEAAVPYSAAALTKWLGRPPENYCSAETALTMACVAYRRGVELLSPGPVPAGGLVGIGCTAALASDRPKRGAHRCYISAQTADSTALYALELEKGARERAGEEALVASLTLDALATACGMGDRPPLELRAGESVEVQTVRAEPTLAAVWQGHLGCVWSLPDGTLHKQLPRDQFPVAPGGLLSGSFHPLHYGHRALRDAAERKLGKPVAYELSLANVDKPPLDYLTIQRRAAQFDAHPLALTHAPTFVQKSRVFPGTTFVVGVDTAERIIRPRYYGGESALRLALAEIRELSCQFLVAGRQVAGRFETLSDIGLPAEFADLFEPLSPAEFRADVSSTDLRTKHEAGGLLADTNGTASPK